VVSNNVVIFPSVLKSIPFDMPGDFTPIAVVGYTPVVLVVNGKVPASNSKELIELLKAKNGAMNYGSGGNGTILHLTGEQYLEEIGAKANHIPYKGVGPMVTDLIGGQIDFGTLALPSVQQHIKSGALRAIGVMGTQRVPTLPDVPTFAEQGFPDVDIAGWFMVAGPKGLPPAQVKRIHDAFVAAFNTPDVKAAMAKQDNVIAPTSPEAAAAFLKSEQERYARLAKKADIKLD
jgi:tripartite-type tricarboxylate transporter receptor subunit TctC